MRLTVVGASGSLPGPGSAASCYLLEAPHEGSTFRLVLDLGSGALGPLQAHAPLDRLGAVVLTHLHPDHCLDLCGLLVARTHAPGGPPGVRLPVLGPEGTAARLAAAYAPEASGLALAAARAAVDSAYDVRTLGGGPARVGPFTVTAARVAHPGQAFALRVEHAGRVLVHSGDTGPCRALVDLAAGADVLLCEAAYRHDAPGPPGVHLTGPEAGEHARAAGVGQLLVTHVPPWYDPDEQAAAARTRFDGPVRAVRAGDVVEV